MQVQFPDWEGPLEEGMAPLQYSCLEKPMDREAWQATVHRAAKSRTRLKQLSTQPTAHTLPIQPFLHLTIELN